MNEWKKNEEHALSNSANSDIPTARKSIKNTFFLRNTFRTNERLLKWRKRKEAIASILKKITLHKSPDTKNGVCSGWLLAVAWQLAHERCKQTCRNEIAVSYLQDIDYFYHPATIHPRGNFSVNVGAQSSSVHLKWVINHCIALHKRTTTPTYCNAFFVSAGA